MVVSIEIDTDKPVDSLVKVVDRLVELRHTKVTVEQAAGRSLGQMMDEDTRHLVTSLGRRFALELAP